MTELNQNISLIQMTLSLGDLDNIFIISVYFLEGLKNLETIFIAYNDLLEYESHKIIDNIAQFSTSILYSSSDF